MIGKSYKTVIEDSSRNRFLFYYSGSSVCCKEISKDGVSRDTIIASQVTDRFLAAIDLQDNIYVICINSDKGLYLFTYEKGEWKLDQILNIQDSNNLYPLSLFAYNGSIHIIYAKQMTIANFYNVIHLHKPSSPSSYTMNTAWRKNNIGEIYAENPDSSYSAAISRDGSIHLVTEWFDGKSYLINYYCFENNSDGWKAKPITALFKKDITVTVLYDEGVLHLLCYTFEDEVSAIFYYTKKEGASKDFEFSCLDKIKSEQVISPYFHIENSTIYVSWIYDNKFYQYSLNKEQKNWIKKLDSVIPNMEMLQNIEYIRNRKSRDLKIKKTYFNVDYKNNINLPYFKENSYNSQEQLDGKSIRNADGDLIRYIPYILDELKSLSESVKSIQERLDKSDNKRSISSDKERTDDVPKLNAEQKQKLSESMKLKKSSFRDQFMNSNKLLNRPEAAALYVGSSSLPNPDAISKKDGINFAENDIVKTDVVATDKQNIFSSGETLQSKQNTNSDATANQPKQDIDSAQKDSNLFKKIGDFFK